MYCKFITTIKVRQSYAKKKKKKKKIRVRQKKRKKEGARAGGGCKIDPTLPLKSISCYKTE
jgi:hypothetical protein